MDQDRAEAAAFGTLYVVATPIGNPEDLSPRASRVLSEVDLVVAEDTRITHTLLARLGLSKRMLSFHDHNEASRVGPILKRLRHGLNVALVSDAGTPLISDPGFRLVRAAAEHGVPIVPIPGPCAPLVALSIAGLPTDRFLVLGFLSRRSHKRRTALRALRREPATLVLFEAPHRVLETLEDVQDVLGDRPSVLARSLTKPHESVLRGHVSELRAALSAQDLVTGEMTLVLEGAGGSVEEDQRDAGLRTVERLLDEGLPTTRIQDIVSDVFGLSHRTVYQWIVRIRSETGRLPGERRS